VSLGLARFTAWAPRCAILKRPLICYISRNLEIEVAIDRTDRYSIQAAFRAAAAQRNLRQHSQSVAGFASLSRGLELGAEGEVLRRRLGPGLGSGIGRCGWPGLGAGIVRRGRPGLDTERGVPCRRLGPGLGARLVTWR